MSQASKQVIWCIAKAKKEIQELKVLGKSPKHRGLLEVKPSIEEARKHIAKAEHNLKAITSFRKTGFSDWSLVAGFYCIYHCFLAIALKFGYESRNQACTIALMEWLKEEGKISIDERFIEMLKYADVEELQESKIIEMREQYTYGTETSIEDETKINELIQTCKEVIDAAKKIVFDK